MFRTYKGTRFQNHCGSGSIESSDSYVFFVVSLWANNTFNGADCSLRFNVQRSTIAAWLCEAYKLGLSQI